MSATGYKINLSSADLNTVFALYVSGTQANPTGYKIKSGDADLNTVFVPYVTGNTKAALTGYKIASGLDLNEVFSLPNIFNQLITGTNEIGFGTDGVNAIYAYDLSHVYIIGPTQTYSGSKTLNRACMWNGTSFSSLGIGCSPYPYSIHGSDPSNIYIAGAFDKSADGSKTLNYISKWDGLTMQPLIVNTKIGLNFEADAVYALDNTHVYIGGKFTANATNAITLNYITMWDGTTFNQLKMVTSVGLGPIDTPTIVKTIYALDTSHVYIGGSFNSAGSVQNVYNITMWDGVNFIKMAPGFQNNVVLCIYALDINHVYVVVSGSIFMWNGTSFTTLGNAGGGISPSIKSVYAVDDTHVYICGNFATINGITNCNGVAMWNGTTFVTMSTGLTISSLSGLSADTISGVNNNAIYIGGSFLSTATGQVMNKITKWGV